jgi:hypothetical protein
MSSSSLFPALVDSLLPADCPAADRPAIALSAEHLLAKRIAGLALPMRVAIKTIAQLFQIATFLMLGRRFEGAAIEARRRAILRAERWPLVPFRELIRLVRSFTLMAFYDHPLTRDRIGFRPGGKAA